MEKIDSDGGIIYPGAQSGILSVTSSGNWDRDHGPDRSRLDYSFRPGSGCPCWASGLLDGNQFLQFSSPIPFYTHRIATHGRTDGCGQWITSYRIMYTIDGLNWIMYNNGDILRGNSDKSTIVEYRLSPFLARSVRINVVTWNEHISTRAELFISDYAPSTNAETGRGASQPYQLHNYL